MRIAEVIGTVTLSHVHPTLAGGRWLIGMPFSLKALKLGQPDGEDLVIFDNLGAGLGNHGRHVGQQARNQHTPQRNRHAVRSAGQCCGAVIGRISELPR